MQFDEQFIKRALPDVSIVGSSFPEDMRFSVDSRTIKSGEIFVALPGSQCDGHDFVAHVLRKGAAGAIIAAAKKSILDVFAPDELKKKLIFIVNDTLEALMACAALWRKQFSYPVVAITGSVGKTSTKELVGAILSLNRNTFLLSQGNQNTKIGVALNMLRMRPEHEMAVFEVGVNKRGEMAQLASLLRPTSAVITNVGHSHMEGLGSLQDIALEKRSLFKYFSEESIGVVNGDQSILAKVSYPHPVIKFGSKTTNQIQARKVRVAGSHISFVLKIYREKYHIALNKPQESFVFNVLAATAVANLLKVPDDIIIEAVQKPLVIPGRFQELPLIGGKGAIINDCYNANPESMKSSLLAFQQIETKAHKIAILGDMLELGVNSPFWHRQLGRFLRKVPSLKELILVGNMVEWIKKAAPVGLPVEIVSSWEDAAALLKTKINRESVVLVKGSHGMNLSHLVKQFSQ